jgi:hypothetical protein
VGSRSHTTFAKRQKELARAERRRDKAAKRMQRKAEKRALGANPDLNLEPDQEGATAPAQPDDSTAGS